MATTAAALSCSCSHSPSPSSTLLRRTVPGFHRTPDAPRRLRLAPLHVVDDSKEVETAAGASGDERSEADRLIDGMDFGELCDDFECISSPYVESTARQIVRDILEIREGNRALSCYAVAVKYKDPLRSFVGREKYKRPLWITEALENPTVSRKCQCSRQAH